MRLGIVLEAARLEQLLLDHVVEAELADGDEHGSAGGPVGAVEQLAEALLAGHADHAVDGVLVAGEKRGRKIIRMCRASWPTVAKLLVQENCIGPFELYREAYLGVGQYCL